MTWLNTSVQNGFARSASEAMFPRLFPDSGWWCPSLNPAMGGTRLWDLRGGNFANLSSFTPSTRWIFSEKLCVYLTGGANAQAPRSSNLVAGNFAISLWINPQTLPGAFTPIFQCNNGGSRELCVYYRSNGAISFTAIGGTTDFADRALGLTTGSWQHFVCTRFGSLVSFYRNGVFTSSVTLSGTTGVSGATINIGDNSSAGDSTANAYYDDIRIYNRALTATEVRQLYQIGRGNMPQGRRRRYTEQAGVNRRRRVLLGAEC